MQLVSLYPYDPTGLAATNKIVNETITVTPPTQVTDYSYVVPRAAPFFAESLVVKDGKTVGARTLVENVDYWCVIDFLSASVALNKRISVGIALLDPSYSGTLYVTYQALGGNYSLADYGILEELVRDRYVVKHVSYEQIVNLPEGFAPEWHQHEVKDMVGMSQVVGKLADIKGAVDGRSGSYGQIDRMITNHVNSENAHNPAQVGLGNVKNFGVATLTDANSGSANKYVTADILKQYVTNNTFNSTGYLTTATAELTYVKLSVLANYDTRAVADGKYAVKGDTYTKAQVEALIAGVDVSDSFSGFYTKGESDSKYFLKTDIASYIKETIADGRYAKQTDLGNYYTKTQSDTNYSPKSALMNYYTKAETDGKYLLATALTSALTPYLTKSDAQSTYLTPSVADGRYVSRTEVSSPNALSVNLTQPTKPVITLRSKTPTNVFSEISCELPLNQFALATNTIDNDKFWLNHYLHLRAINGVYIREFTTTVVYRTYQLTVDWKIKRIGAVFHLSWVCTNSFYFAEETFYLYTCQNTGTANASATTAHGALPANTNSPIAGDTSYTSSVSLLTCFHDIVSNHRYSDAWLRLAGQVRVNKNNGSVIIPLFYNGAAGANSTDYTYGGFTGAISFTLDDASLEKVMMKWFDHASARHQVLGEFNLGV